MADQPGAGLRRFVNWWIVYEEIRQTDGSRNVYVNVLPAVVGLLVVSFVLGWLL